MTLHRWGAAHVWVCAAGWRYAMGATPAAALLALGLSRGNHKGRA